MDSLTPASDIPTVRPQVCASRLETVLNAVERLAVVGSITFVWAAGKLDSTIAVVALTAVVGVSLGERRLKAGKGGGAALVLAVAGFASSLAPYGA